MLHDRIRTCYVLMHKRLSASGRSTIPISSVSVDSAHVGALERAFQLNFTCLRFRDAKGTNSRAPEWRSGVFRPTLTTQFGTENWVGFVPPGDWIISGTVQSYRPISAMLFQRCWPYI